MSDFDPLVPLEPARTRRRIAALRASTIALPDNVRGGLWLLFAGIFFVAMTGLIKEAGQTIPVVQILLLRQIFMGVTVFPAIARNFPRALKTRAWKWHALRVLAALTAMVCGFTAVVHIPLADATAIAFSKSFFITIFAILLLGETVGIRRWSAIATGFLGVLVMVGPTGAMNAFYSLLAVVGAASAGLALVSIRRLSRQDSPLTILTYQIIFVGLAIAPFAIWFWVWPSPREWLVLVAIGIVSVIAQLANIRGFRAGEAAAIAPLDYSRLIYATLLGALAFGESPSGRTLLGAAIILAASLYTMHRETVLTRQRDRADGTRTEVSP